MLTFLDIIIFILLGCFLVTIIIKSNTNEEAITKKQAYICIATIGIETLSLIIRIISKEQWFMLLILLVIQCILSFEIIVDANQYGAFKRKKKTGKNLSFFCW